MTTTLPPLITDEAMEVLCLLSPTPASIQSIARDLGMTRQKPVRKLIEQLREAGIRIETHWSEDGAGSVAWIASKWFRPAYKLAMEWVEKQEAGA